MSSKVRETLQRRNFTVTPPTAGSRRAAAVSPRRAQTVLPGELRDPNATGVVDVFRLQAAISRADVDGKHVEAEVGKVPRSDDLRAAEKGAWKALEFVGRPPLPAAVKRQALEGW